MQRPLTENIVDDQPPLDFEAYRRAGGYSALSRALTQMSREEVIDVVSRAQLRGRGGAGFPTGKKWSFVPKGVNGQHPRYLVVNGDEMEPGTFKDRLLLEGAPHLVIEGALIAAYAIAATRCFVFLRWAYRTAARRLNAAAAELRAAGYLGRNILGSGFDCELDVHVSGGRYMCGEETALLNSLEGKRATPRARPPFPQASGLWGKPTVVNNVETIANVPLIVDHGADWFLGLSRCDDGGTKLYGVSGRVRRPGLWELPMGTTLREVLEQHAGGMQEGYAFRGAIPGGGSTDFMIESQLDVMLDFDHVQAAGSRLGTGTIIVLDDRTCPVGMLLNLEQFYARESCGWCTPCREGLPWIAQLLAEIEAGRGEPSDLDLLWQHAGLLGPGHTFCALAPGAMEPLQSGLRYFREDFERHIVERRCPWRAV